MALDEEAYDVAASLLGEAGRIKMTMAILSRSGLGRVVYQRARKAPRAKVSARAMQLEARWRELVRLCKGRAQTASVTSWGMEAATLTPSE